MVDSVRMTSQPFVEVSRGVPLLHALGRLNSPDTPLVADGERAIQRQFSELARSTSSMPKRPGSPPPNRPYMQHDGRRPGGLSDAWHPNGAQGHWPARIVVIDQFDRKTINLNVRDTIPDVSHGELVARIAESGLGRQVERVQTGPHFLDTIADTLKRVIEEEAEKQRVPRSKVNLGHVVVNVSCAVRYPLSDVDRSALEPLVARFAAQGGRLYVSAGNSERNDLMSLPGTVGVDGSEGIVGSPLIDRQPSTRYDNGPVSRVANAVVRPLVLEGGGVDINFDRRPDFGVDELSPLPQGTLAGQLLDASSTMHTNDFRQLIQDNGLLQTRLLNIPDGPSGEQISELSVELLNTRTSQKVMRLSDALEALGGDRNVLSNAVSPDLDPSLTYLQADQVVSIATSHRVPWTLVLYEVDQSGRLATVPDRGAAANIYGTSFASPSALVEDWWLLHDEGRQ